MDQVLAVLPLKDALILMAVFGVAAAADAWLPPTPPTSRWYKLRRLLSLVGQNYRYAANEVYARETAPAAAVPTAVVAEPAAAK